MSLEFASVPNVPLVTRARNHLVHHFLSSPANHTHLLFIDADVAFFPAAIERLLAFGAPVVGAAYPRKEYDWDRAAALLAGGAPAPDAAALRELLMDYAFVLPVRLPGSPGGACALAPSCQRLPA